MADQLLHCAHEGIGNQIMENIDFVNVFMFNDASYCNIKETILQFIIE